MVLQRAARSKDTTPVKQRPPVKPQPICPPNALAKGFTMGRGRPLSSSGQRLLSSTCHCSSASSA